VLQTLRHLDLQCPQSQALQSHALRAKPPEPCPRLNLLHNALTFYFYLVAPPPGTLPSLHVRAPPTLTKSVTHVLWQVNEFFHTLAGELTVQPEWAEWFVIPFLRDPATHPAFETFFTRAWLDSFTFSLHNFLSTVFQNLPLPALLARGADHRRLEALEGELQALRSSAARTRGVGGDAAVGAAPTTTSGNQLTGPPPAGLETCVMDSILPARQPASPPACVPAWLPHPLPPEGT